MTNTMKKDATEFGVHVKQGGWRLGLLVARNVEKGAGEGGYRRGNDRYDRTGENEKVSGAEFARESGTSRPRVIRYLDAWNKAAEAGLVTASDDLEPGAEIDLNVDDLPEWGNFYSANAGKASAESEDSRRAQADADGTGLTTVHLIAKNKKAMASAIKGDPRVAEAARAALGLDTPEAKREAFINLAHDEDVSGDASTRGTTGRHFEHVTRTSDYGLKKARAKEKSEAQKKDSGFMRWMEAASALDEAEKHIDAARDEITHARLDEEHRDLLRDHVKQVAHALDLMSAEIDGTATPDWDAGLVNLTGGTA